MKHPNSESVSSKDFEQLRRGDWLMRLTRNEFSVYRRFTKVTPIEFTTKPIRRGNIDYKRIENMTPFNFRTRPMRIGNIDYSSSDRITRVEFRTTPTRKDDTDWKFTDNMMLFDATIGSKNYTICKILVTNIFPTDGGQLNNLYASNSGFRMRWPNFTVVLTV